MFNIDKKNLTLDENGNLRPDFLFSYWCLAWFIIYYFIDSSSRSPIGQFIKKEMNPLLALIAAFGENLITFFYMIYLQSDFINLFRYLIMMFIIKIYPIYLLSDYKIQWFHDILVLIIVFIIYIIYLHFWNTDILKIYKKTFTSIHEGKTETPFFQFMEKIGL